MRGFFFFLVGGIIKKKKKKKKKGCEMRVRKNRKLEPQMVGSLTDSYRNRAFKISSE